MDVEWKSIDGWDYYEVSSDGQIRSLDKLVNGKNGSLVRKKGRVLKTANHRGYLAVRLRDSAAKKDRTYKVHRLVLETFVGPPSEGQESRHLNGICTDNRLENLAWGSKSQNNNDRVLHGTHHNAAKTHCPQGHTYDLVISGSRKCSKCRRKQFLDFHERRKKSK